jgi:hypothetical protein
MGWAEDEYGLNNSIWSLNSKGVYETLNGNGEPGKTTWKWAYDKNITLYAVWNNKWNLTYKGNGGKTSEGKTEIIDKNNIYGQNYTIKGSDLFTPPEGKVFSSWSESSDKEDGWKNWAGENWTWGEGGGNYKRHITLYAIWKDEVAEDENE